MVSLLLLVQAGASGSRQALAPSPTATPRCTQTFRVAFVADVAGLGSSVDAAAWRGVGAALGGQPCVLADLALPARPSEYRRLLQADAGYDLVIAGSFLLTDPVVDIARANPSTRFVLVDPIVVPPDVSNLAVLTFRSDQAAFLAGALAGMVTRTGAVAGVYGPDGLMDRMNRSGFEGGARYVRQGIQVLGAYQPPGGAPYADPVWGRDQARAFTTQHADVIFGTGGTTGEGALRGAEQAGIACINEDLATADRPGCLLATSLKFVDRGVQMAVADAIAGRWRSGLRSMGLAEHAIALSLRTDPRLTSEVRARIQTIADLLADGSLATGG